MTKNKAIAWTGCAIVGVGYGTVASVFLKLNPSSEQQLIFFAGIVVAAVGSALYSRFSAKAVS